MRTSVSHQWPALMSAIGRGDAAGQASMNCSICSGDHESTGFDSSGSFFSRGRTSTRWSA
jgi:hypothetical protein